MKQIKYIVFVSLFVNILSAETRCSGGGDGGTPFTSVSTELLSNPAFVKTDYLLKDFLIWEKAGSLIYRSEIQELRHFSLMDGSEKKLTSLGKSLSQLSDERYITTEDSLAVLDTAVSNYPTWKSLNFPGPVKEQAFWYGSLLYVIGRPYVNGTTQVIPVYGINPQTGKLRSCPVSSPINSPLHLAQGHTAPYIYFYKTVKIQGGYDLISYRLNVDAGIILNHCKLEELKPYADPMPGPVLGMHRLENLDAFIVKIDHPSKKVLWDQGPDCKYYDTESNAVYVLNNELPLVALWNREGGLAMLDLQRSKGALLRNIPKMTVSQKDLWLTKSKRLFVTQESIPGSSDKVLFSVDLTKISD